MSRLHLLESYCLPVLIYAIGFCTCSGGSQILRVMLALSAPAKIFVAFCVGMGVRIGLLSDGAVHFHPYFKYRYMLEFARVGYFNPCYSLYIWMF